MADTRYGQKMPMVLFLKPKKPSKTPWLTNNGDRSRLEGVLTGPRWNNRNIRIIMMPED